MNSYEGIFIIKPELAQEENQKLLEDIQQNILKDNGKIENIENWGKRKLAYPIAGYKEAVYYKIDFLSEPSKMEGLNRTYRLFGNILRFMFVKKG